MRKIKLYIATTLDSFIAKSDGNIDFLNSIPNPEGLDYGYKDFLDSIDTTIMGNSTYKEILGFGIPFPYPDKTNYVLTKSDSKDNEFVKFINSDIIEFTKNLLSQDGKDIWLIGGGKINTIYLNNDFIDEMIITMFPIILGDGIRLFENQPNEKKFNLSSIKKFDTGIMQIILTKNDKI